ncbi:lipoprotein [Micromonospora thermarum]|uniref:DUF3558 domain-containing protein n=1 Tax=Micromonospora thermarum TaxID=2720024 RepID=A0ABX0Z7J1_9ACTN|nr:lipoprotein [Micromonospora thermarum]NJP32924.1 hypothetical protein [Micromonospora thermarum]
MARRTRAALLAALTVVLLAGCGDDDAPVGTTGEPWYDEVAAEEAGGAIGGADSPCPLPVSFPVPEQWKAEAVEIPTGELAEVAEALIKRGGATMRCELDGARRNAGFLRVWTTDQPAVAPRAALEAFVAADTKHTVAESRYRDVKAGGFAATEATWLATSELIQQESRHWALAVQANGQTVVFTVNAGFKEPADVLPAYRLATQGLAATR